MPIEKKLLIIELVLLNIAMLIWILFTDGTRDSLSVSIFWVGMGSILAGIALICGAWRGYREPDVDYILGPSLQRSANSFQDVKRGYADLNLFALAGVVAILLSVLI